MVYGIPSPLIWKTLFRLVHCLYFYPPHPTNCDLYVVDDGSGGAAEGLIFHPWNLSYFFIHFFKMCFLAIRDLYEIKVAHILSLGDNFQIAPPASSTNAQNLSQYHEK